VKNEEFFAVRPENNGVVSLKNTTEGRCKPLVHGIIQQCGNLTEISGFAIA